MADAPFTDYAFPARGAPTNRTLPDRLGRDIVNVKDFGAVGDGVADDTTAINTAIAYAYTLNTVPGAIVFIPSGTYLIGNPPLFVGRLAGSHQGCLQVIGAGRDATVLKGNYSAGYLVEKAPSIDPNDNIVYVADLTVMNDSQTIGSGALRILSIANALALANCHFKGTIGVAIDFNTFGESVRNCLFTCSIPIGKADSTAPGPAAGSVAIYCDQGQVVGCHASGFDVAYAARGPGVSIISCSADRCNIGAYLGLQNVPDHIYDQPGQFWFVGGGSVLCNKFDRCKWGIFLYNLGGGIVASNICSGRIGVADPAPIENMSWEAASRVVTVTTPAAHNIAPGSRPLQLLSISPPAFIPTGQGNPDGSGDGIVTITQTGANTFQYLGPTSNPGPFGSGAWNYPLEYGITVKAAVNVVFAANVLPAVVSIASFDTYRNGDTGTQRNNICMSMRGPYGWAQIPSGMGGNASWQFINCGTVGKSPPISLLQYRDLPGQSGVQQGLFEGAEYSINDAQTQPAFVGIVTAGGSNHYKVRYDGKNWIRVG